MGVAPSVLPGGADVSDARARDRLGEVWGCEIPQREGLDLTGVLEAAAAGKIKAAYVMGDDPSATHPGAVEALKNVDFLVVQDAVDGPLTGIADVVLPGLSFAEKRGTFTSMERAIQRVRPALKPERGARRDLEILSEIAARMGSTLESDAATVMEEIARVNPSYSHVSYEALDDGAMRWPVSDSEPRGAASLLDGELPSGYPTLAPVSAAPAALSVDENEMRVLTGQRRFHSGHLSRMAKGLTEAYPEPLAELSPQDAQRLGVKDGMIVKLASSKGEVKAKVKVTGKSLPGTVFLPFGFAEASAAELLGWNGEARIVKAGVSVEKA
jgi:predicted molibdopterin-dependent oxidoreductase YjgC